MAKGENIFKRKDGRWEARYIRGHEETGKIRYGFCYGRTYREAKEKVTVCKAAVAAGEPLPQIKTAQHFSFFCDAWLAVRKTQVRVSTYSKYAAVLEKHIKPHLGRYLPQDITTVAVDAFSQELLASLSPKTVHDILVTLHGILKYTAGCVAQALPHVEIHYPKEEKREMRVLTREEQARFVAYLSADITPCKFGLLLALFTGMRIGELCALKWENICVAERTVRVAATLQRLQENGAAEKGHTHIVIGAPKSGASARIIPLTAQTAALCLQMQAAPSAYVLTGSAAYMEPRALQYRIEKYVRACGLQGVHCHTLRHTFATRAVEVGFEIKSLSEILGHASTTITLERYVHSSLELKRQNMDKLAAVGL